MYMMKTINTVISVAQGKAKTNGWKAGKERAKLEGWISGVEMLGRGKGHVLPCLMT